MGDAATALDALLTMLDAREGAVHLDAARAHDQKWSERQRAGSDPGFTESGLIARVRSAIDNPDERIRPEAVAAAIDRAAPEDRIFTTDTGMSTAGLAHFVRGRRLRQRQPGHGQAGAGTAGLPAFGTELDNADLAAVAVGMGLHPRRVQDPAPWTTRWRGRCRSTAPCCWTWSPTPTSSHCHPTSLSGTAGDARSPG